MNVSIQEKIKYILLNKVQGLNWNYFNLLTENISIAAKAEPDYNWFDKIEIEEGKYVWKGSACSDVEIVSHVYKVINKQPSMLQDVMLEIYRDGYIANESEADKGTMGKLNQENCDARNDYFRYRMKQGFRAKKGNYIVLAEGDSWFLFPKVALRGVGRDFVKDIGDHLIEKENIAWYNIAFGGDWISNMIYESKFIEELDQVEPHVFLISGGGNDFVGKRLMNFIRSETHENRIIESQSVRKRLLELRQKQKKNVHPTFDPKRYELGLSYIDDRFIDFLNLIYIQYLSLFIRIYHNTSKFENLLTLTQGYDYPIPSDKNTRFIEFGHRALNKIIGNGDWLLNPLETKGICDQKKREAIMYTLVYEFNETLLTFERSGKFKNVFHIDNRGVAKSKDDWFDELHLESEVFKKVADKYYKKIKDFFEKG